MNLRIYAVALLTAATLPLTACDGSNPMPTGAAPQAPSPSAQGQAGVLYGNKFVPADGGKIIVVGRPSESPKPKINANMGFGI